jgi:hypothetical protein
VSNDRRTALSDLLGEVGRLRWTTELQSLRREVRRLFNRCRKNNSAQSWELYRETQRRFRKEVRKLPKRLGGLSVTP